MHPLIAARWFDGRSSQARLVRVSLRPDTKGPCLLLHREAGAAPLTFAHRQVGWPESWSERRAPRTVVVDLREHGSLEIDDVGAWKQALAQAGARAPLAQRMQTRWTAFVVVLLTAAAALGAFYRWGTPWAATQVTRQVPLSWETGLSERAMRDLDEGWLKPSKLPLQRQVELRAAFEVLSRRITPELRRYRGYAPTLNLHFRSGLGANAFALPGGTIVLTDAMVEAAAKQKLPDEALIGVLAHEIGHVMHRHTTRMVVEQGVLNIGLGLALGDVSSLVSIGGSVLTGLAYRRSHETEADCFAVALMRQARMPTEPMADLLLGLDGNETRDQSRHAEGKERSAWMGLLSSHPYTPERARMLKLGDARSC